MSGTNPRVGKTKIKIVGWRCAYPTYGRFIVSNSDVKTYKNLYSEIHSFENLLLAFRQARRGKRSRPNVAEFEVDSENQLLQIQYELQSRSYQPGAYRHFTLYERKPRRISAAPFRDRVVHHALCNVIAPIWESRFIDDSYACRVGKGTHSALDRCTQFAGHYPYVLQMDIKRFFPSVDHGILYQLLRRYIGDHDCLNLIKKIIDSGRNIHDQAQQSKHSIGLPIGNQTSQFWANVYLHPLDDFVKRDLKCKPYLRYCDDFLLFASEKSTLWGYKTAILSFLESLRLNLNQRTGQVFPVTQGIPFLGFKVFPAHRRLQACNGYRFQRRWKRMRRLHVDGKMSGEELRQRLQSWIAHVNHGDTWHLRSRILNLPY